MNDSPLRRVVMAIGTAVLMHLLLFVFFFSAGGRDPQAAPLPPGTFYAVQASEAEGDETLVRILKSPVVFSLPSRMGFSRELAANEVQTRKAFMQQQVRSEYFLDIEPSILKSADQLDSLALMISGAVRGPNLPASGSGSADPFPPAKRVTLSAGIRGRLIGGIVLPPELNAAVEKPWAVRASVVISDQGGVENVFLDQPLESAALNHQILRVLHGLRFKPGTATDGYIEIFSPEPVTAEGSPE